MIDQAIALSMAACLALVSAPEPEAPSEAPPPQLVAPPPPQPIEVDPRNYNMVLAGNIVIGLGGGGLIAMIVGLGLRADAVSQRRALGVVVDPDTAAIARQDRRIRTGTILAISGGAAAGALFVSGITLVALGHARERRRRESLSLIPTPSFDRNSVGLRWSLRF